MAAIEFPLALAAGSLSHVFYFNRGEHHLYASKYIQLFIAAVVIPTFSLYSRGLSFQRSLSDVVPIIITYLVGLYTSLIVYRVCFHPLNKFPGPFGARISNFWFSSKLKNADAYRKLQQLHSEHGRFLRIGSSDLSISHPKAVHAIYGQDSKCTKAPWYDLTAPMVSLQTLRVKAFHDRRRRVWSSAFSDKALRGYELRVQKFRNKLFAQIDAFSGRPINVSKWFNLYSFDVMGDLAFGASFNMLEASEEHWAIKLLNEGIEPLAWMFPIWFFRIMTAIPGLTRDWWRFIGYCASKVDERRRSKPEFPDIMSSLLKVYQGREPAEEELNILQGDSQLIVVAGSDTTAATLTHIMLELCRNPQHIQKLREELGPYMQDPSAEVLHQDIANLEHLNGVIWEALRLHPPVPSALPRKTPEKGIHIDGVFVPGNMTVYCPQYVLGRSDDIYSSAEAFLPERWYLYPDMVKEKSAWAPFSAGSYGCIGRPLALLNLRTTVARLVMTFEISFDPEDLDCGRSFEADSREHFTLAPAALNICFKRRH